MRQGVMPKVYPLGYSHYGADKRIDELMQQETMLLIDTRLKPYSWRPEWRSDALRAKYQGRYRVAGAFLGNLNFNLPNGWPIKIADPATGIRGLMRYLSEGHDLILLCQCACYDNCHRKEIVRLLQEAMESVEIVLPEVVNHG